MTRAEPGAAEFGDLLRAIESQQLVHLVDLLEHELANCAWLTRISSPADGTLAASLAPAGTPV